MTKALNDLQTASDFKEYFSTIPDCLWTTAKYEGDNNCKCAIGHLGATNNEPMGGPKAFLFREMVVNASKGDFSVFAVNDGAVYSFQQIGPKARILALCDFLIEKGY